MRVLLVSTYDLGRQPTGLARPAARLRQAGADVTCVDVSRDTLEDRDLSAADLIAFYLPMHTATRLAAPIIGRARAANPAAQLAAYGLYAPLNAGWLREQGIAHVLGPDADVELLSLVRGDAGPAPSPAARLPFLQPDRTALPALARYAALQMPDGTRRVVGTTDATHGCKHLCRHCPIVPVYHGHFRAVPLDVVLADVRAQVAAGAQHVTFGDPDFFNGPTHARRLVERLAAEFPGLTYDATIKVEHLLAHADLLPLLRATGCLFITSAVESFDDATLEKLRKGHTRADVARAVAICRDAGVPLSPTFVPFNPWTTRESYRDLLRQIEDLDLVEAVAPIQLGIRLLVTAESALLELPDIRGTIGPFDGASLMFPWRHQDPAVDALQTQVMRLVGLMAGRPRTEVFEAIVGLEAGEMTRATASPRAPRGATPPYLTEGWYCCAEPGPEQLETM